MGANGWLRNKLKERTSYLAALNRYCARGQSHSLYASAVISESDPPFEGYQRFADAVEKRTNGDMEVEVFPNAPLGPDEDLMEQALLGANVAFNTDAGRLGQRVPEVGIVLLSERR